MQLVVMPSLHPYHSEAAASLSNIICTLFWLYGIALKTVAAPTLVHNISSISSVGAKETREIPNALLKYLERKGLLPVVF